MTPKLCEISSFTCPRIARASWRPTRSRDRRGHFWGRGRGRSRQPPRGRTALPPRSRNAQNRRSPRTPSPNIQCPFPTCATACPTVPVDVAPAVAFATGSRKASRRRSLQPGLSLTRSSVPRLQGIPEPPSQDPAKWAEQGCVQALAQPAENESVLDPLVMITASRSRPHKTRIDCLRNSAVRVDPRAVEFDRQRRCRGIVRRGIHVARSQEHVIEPCRRRGYRLKCPGWLGSRRRAGLRWREARTRDRGSSRLGG